MFAFFLLCFLLFQPKELLSKRNSIFPTLSNKLIPIARMTRNISPLTNHCGVNLSRGHSRQSKKKVYLNFLFDFKRKIL